MSQSGGGALASAVLAFDAYMGVLAPDADEVQHAELVVALVTVLPRQPHRVGQPVVHRRLAGSLQLVVVKVGKVRDEVAITRNDLVACREDGSYRIDISHLDRPCGDTESGLM
jgi:hypothetical protein